MFHYELESLANIHIRYILFFITNNKNDDNV